MTETTPKSGHFREGGVSYARHRPSYPAALASALAKLAPARTLALDVGCGTGQLSLRLAAEFATVLASDVSQGQIDAAAPAPNIIYRHEPAERSSAKDASADLIVAAQAAHWFELPEFYDEARRVAASGAVIALVSYGVMELDGELAARFEDFYWREIHAYWPPERSHVENGYRDLPFPFAPLPAPEIAIERDWTLEELLGYIGTWSATRAATAANNAQVISTFAHEFAEIWGAADKRRRIRWPISCRVGRIGPR